MRRLFVGSLALGALVAFAACDGDQVGPGCEDDGTVAYAGAAVTVGFGSSAESDELWGRADVSIVAGQPYEHVAGEDTVCGGPSFDPIAISITKYCSLAARLGYPDVSASIGKSARFLPAGGTVAPTDACVLPVGGGATATIAVQDGSVTWTEGHLSVHVVGDVVGWTAAGAPPASLVWDFEGDASDD